MAYYLSADGLAYNGDRQIRADGTLDRQLPDRPSLEHEWDGSQWAEPTATPKWQKLEAKLRQSDLFSKAFSTVATNAWSLLLATLHSNAAPDDAGRLGDFQFAIAAIRQGLAPDFTPEQLARFNQILSDCDFPFRVS